MRKSPGPLAWHLRPYRKSSPFCLLFLFSMPFLLLQTQTLPLEHAMISPIYPYLYTLFSLQLPAWGIPSHPSGFSSKVSFSEALAWCGPHSSRGFPLQTLFTLQGCKFPLLPFLSDWALPESRVWAGGFSVSSGASPVGTKQALGRLC